MFSKDTTLDTKAVFEMLTNVRNELLKIMVTQSQFENTGSKIEALERETKTMSNYLMDCETDIGACKEEYRGGIGELRGKIDEILKSSSGKIDCEIFDDEIHTLRDAIT